jgi:hypothetical protein
VHSERVLPRSAPEQEAIRTQLGRVLASQHFKSSRHYPAFLKYVVEQTLAGDSGHLKERALGVAVFGREPQYDSNADPVVRTSACEVRKRLAQYYTAGGREGELRIDLPSGSYVPEFRVPEPAAPAPVVPAPVLAARSPWRRPPLLLIGAGTLGLVALAVMTAGTPGPRSAADRFWNPVWRDGDAATICVAAPYNPDGRPVDGADPTYLEVMKADRMAFADALAMARLVGMVKEFGQRYDVRRVTSSTLADFRRGPLILIGAFNNPWTMRLTSQLRFTFERDAAVFGGMIRDRQNPAKVWTHHPDLPYSKLTDDYAIISRFVDKRTEQTVVVVAGLGKDGTIAASEFVTEPRYLEALASASPRGWEKMNLQVVISTELINGNAGPPKIVDKYFW